MEEQEGHGPVNVHQGKITSAQNVDLQSILGVHATGNHAQSLSVGLLGCRTTGNTTATQLTARSIPVVVRPLPTVQAGLSSKVLHG